MSSIERRSGAIPIIHRKIYVSERDRTKDLITECWDTLAFDPRNESHLLPFILQREFGIPVTLQLLSDTGNEVENNQALTHAKRIAVFTTDEGIDILTRLEASSPVVNIRIARDPLSWIPEEGEQYKPPRKIRHISIEHYIPPVIPYTVLKKRVRNTGLTDVDQRSIIGIYLNSLIDIVRKIKEEDSEHKRSANRHLLNVLWGEIDRIKKEYGNLPSLLERPDLFEDLVYRACDLSIVTENLQQAS